MVARVAMLCAAAALFGACATGTDLGECDQAAAEEVVFGSSGVAATKGQALAHDSCGNGVFCHSSSAAADERFGVPKHMDFDMLPAPAGLGELLSRSGEAWELVRDGQMPPPELHMAVVGYGRWTTRVGGGTGSISLPTLQTDAGKGAFRNWLACGAPVVVDTQVPAWAHPDASGFGDGGVADWSTLYETVFAPRCALAGCHSPASAAGGLPMAGACETLEALRLPGDCGEAPLAAGGAEGPLLLDKLQSATPRCGDPMPPEGMLPPASLDAIVAWIEAGAEADDCR